jgi:catechol 2,3-dioxygenase-like lactoylglutathione lyase family enzyme
MRAPSLAGVSHVSLSVADVDAAARFWSEVMGFDAVAEESGFQLLVHRASLTALIVSDHGAAVRAPFDERRVGLDHLALAVPDDASLADWERHLTACAIPHSGITTSDGGRHLNLRAPDEVPVELFVIEPSDESRKLGA